MKAILKFDLPEEEKAHLRAVKALDFVLFINDFERWLKEMEDSSRELNLEVTKHAFYECLKDNHIDLEELSG